MTNREPTLTGWHSTNCHVYTYTPVNTPSQPQAPLEAAIRRARGNGADILCTKMFITNLRSLVKGSRANDFVNMSAKLSAVGTLVTASVPSASRSRTIV